MTTALVLIAVCSLVFVIQWNDIKSSYLRQNTRYIQNLTAFADKYLDGYTGILEETVRQVATLTRGEKVEATNETLRHWFFERLNSMPDVQSLIYADHAGNFIRLPNATLPEEYRNDHDPRTKIWYTEAVRDEFDNAHYTNGEDIFDNNHKTLTISKSLVNSEDGEKAGVLAIRLNLDASKYILDTAHPPLTGRTWIVDKNGQQIASVAGNIDPQLLRTVTALVSKEQGYFHLPKNDNWYFYHEIGNTDWLLMYEVNAGDMNGQVYTKSANVLYCLLFALIALLVCWWTVRGALNALYIRIANGIRNGAIEQKAAEQLLYEEIHNSGIQQELIKNEALTDGLTELKNRRAFDNDIEFHQQSPDIGLAIIDIDNFKAVNDTYGHAAGDMVLKTVSDIGLRLRGLDNITLYRYGGEEIAVLFQGMSPQEALGYLNLWREACEQRQFREPNLHVSFSGGLCMKEELSVEEAMIRADSLLYKAKRNGKNRIMYNPD